MSAAAAEPSWYRARVAARAAQRLEPARGAHYGGAAAARGGLLEQVSEGGRFGVGSAPDLYVQIGTRREGLRDRALYPSWFVGEVSETERRIRQTSERDLVSHDADELVARYALRADCAHIPTAGAINSPFGMRRSIQDPSRMRQHQGVDLAGDVGADVFAIADGIVEHATVNGARGFACYGHVIVLWHPQHGQLRSFYAHLSAVLVPEGTIVRAGELVAGVGNTNGSEVHPGTTFRDGACSSGAGGAHLRPGGGSGPHLHFELAERRYPMPYDAPRIDPIAWLGAHGLPYTENARGGRPVRASECSSAVATSPATSSPPIAARASGAESTPRAASSEGSGAGAWVVLGALALAGAAAFAFSSG